VTASGTVEDCPRCQQQAGSPAADGWRAVFEDLRATLVAEQERRGQRQGWVDGELEWVLAERAAMTQRVNRIRARYGLGPVAASAVQAVEQRAAGHIDYIAKYAIGCADLAVYAAAGTDPAGAS
jgi:hypothetical protein